MEKLFKLEAFLKQKLSTLKGYGTFFRAFLLVPAGRSEKQRITNGQVVGNGFHGFLAKHVQSL